MRFDGAAWARIGGVWLAVIVVALVSVGPAAAATPATLTGESFFADRVAGNGTLNDNAEPGTGADTFAIQAGSYSAGGTLTQGNIQVHG